jgi:large subunit ribosomal protein L1
MLKVSKRFFKLQNIIKKKKYSYDIAINLLKKLSTTKFVESAEAHILLNTKNKKNNQYLRAQLSFPHSINKKIKIAVFCELEEMNVDFITDVHIIGTDSIVKNIESGNIDFNVLITTQKYMPIITKYARFLGPKGLVPSTKLGTLTTNIDESIHKIKNGNIEYKTDKNGIIHITFGKLNFTETQLKENLSALYFSVIQKKPVDMRTSFINSFHICTTMSPSILLDIHSFKK